MFAGFSCWLSFEGRRYSSAPNGVPKLEVERWLERFSSFASLVGLFDGLPGGLTSC